MGRFVVRRLALAAVTLLLLSVLIFVAAQFLPGDVARAILGPLADERAVQALRQQLGVDRPAHVLYLDWMAGFLQGDLGRSLAFRRPVADLLWPALTNSAKLGAFAFLVVAPLGILGGVVAALNQGRWPDRVISVAGLSATVVPEFVSGIIFIILFGVWLKWLPITATAPAGAGALVQMYHLILPTLPLVLVLFGYIARMARAGVVEALASDYTRTAFLKGLSRRTVIWRHVLRNALIPTISVLATQTGYLLGGLVVVEVLFRYQGLGNLIFNAARAKDFPMLQSGVMVIGVIYIGATFLADLATAWLNPRVRLGER
jgi:peptide/nickel transport system permease protein